MKRTILILFFGAFLAGRSPASDDPVTLQQQRAEAAAVVVLVQTEPNGEQTRFKIVEFWKRKASEADISRYFADGYLPATFPRPLVSGQQLVAYYFLPASGWADHSNLQLGPGVIDGKFTFNQLHESKPKQEYTVPEFKRLLTNDKEPVVLSAPFCPVK